MSINNIFTVSLIAITIGCGCSKIKTQQPNDATSLKETLLEIADNAPGTVGIAFVSERDTITINNGVHFPMMSVFKLHQSLAVAHKLDSLNQSFDSILNIRSSELDPNTWSPMLDKYGNRDLNITVGELVNYAITVSDNNASNILFNHIVSPAETDNYVKSIAPDSTFNIVYSEAEMKQNHAISYSNYTSPLASALLIEKVFSNDFVSSTKQNLIREALLTTSTGIDRLGSVLKEDNTIVFAHKTGSGYRNAAGELTAHNDVGYFIFPDGHNYSLAVFIRDFSGTDKQASDIIARISHAVFIYHSAGTHE